MEQEKEIDLVEIFNKLWQDRRTIIKWGCVGLAAGIVIAFSIPREYTSSVQFVTESKNIGQDASSAAGMAAMMGINLAAGSTAGIDERIYPDIIRSSPFMNEFKDMRVEVKGGDVTLQEYLANYQKRAWWSHIFALPYTVAEWFSSDSGDEVDAASDPFRPDKAQRNFESALASRTSTETDSKSDIMTLTVKMQSPEVAAILADSMISKLEQYMVEYYTHKTRNDLIQGQKSLEQARNDYYAADAVYAEVMDKNQDLVFSTARIKVERAANERDLAFTIYQQVATQVEMTRLKLQEETPIATVIEPARVPLQASSPNKKLIVIALTFLAVVVRAGVVMVREVVKS